MASCHSPSSSDHSRDELCHQPLAVAALDRIDTRLLTIGKLDPQQPAVLAQLHGADEPIRRYCGVRCSIHLPVSPLRPITTWTKEIAGKLRRAFVPAHSIFPAFHSGCGIDYQCLKLALRSHAAADHQHGRKLGYCRQVLRSQKL